jgi:hypothetical protein
MKGAIVNDARRCRQSPVRIMSIARNLFVRRKRLTGTGETGASEEGRLPAPLRRATRNHIKREEYTS